MSKYLPRNEAVSLQLYRVPQGILVHRKKNRKKTFFYVHTTLCFYLQEIYHGDIKVGSCIHKELTLLVVQKMDNNSFVDVRLWRRVFRQNEREKNKCKNIQKINREVFQIEH